ncbi:protein MRP-126-like [Carettochelys insculpta]|uniref:protein MRP-126-like n=1 Tax=Carettochelys insculpta TaxID=44489 RepID=UPI003EB6B9B4
MSQMIKGNLSELEKALEVIIDIFHMHSARVGHFDTLTKGELKQLIESQLVNFLKNQTNHGNLDQLFKDLDKNKDQQLSFGEFMTLISQVTVDTHEHLHHADE